MMKLQDMCSSPRLVASGIAFVALLAAPAATQTYATPAGGSFFPDGSTVQKSFHLVETAANATSSGGTVRMTDGYYSETPTLEHSNVTLEAFPGGVVTIGKLDQHEEIPFSMYTMNTHLFGDGSDGGPCLICFDTVGEYPGGGGSATRAEAIGAYIRDDLTTYDVICLQEVWDQDNRDAITLELGGLWPYRFYGGALADMLDCLNSGLFILSKYPLTEAIQGAYLDQADDDALSSKGWLQCTVAVNKGGSSVNIGLFTTHTQAGALNSGVRTKQLTQLKIFTDQYKMLHPMNPIFICGDFNIAQLSSDCGASFCLEYDLFFAPMFSGFRDVHPSVPSWYDLSGDAERYTARQGNDLWDLFNPTEASQRLDYIMYEPGYINLPFAVIPTDAFVDTWGPVSWTGMHVVPGCAALGLVTSTDLSDHQGVAASFKIYK